MSKKYTPVSIAAGVIAWLLIILFALFVILLIVQTWRQF